MDDPPIDLPSARARRARRRWALVAVGVVVAILVGGALAIRAVIDRARFGNATELHRAILVGDPDRARELIAEGADVNAVMYGALAPTLWNVTPLHLAASKNDRSLVALLLERGAMREAVDNLGRTPLYAALEEGADEAAQTLIAAGASVRADVATERARAWSETRPTPLQVALLHASRSTVEAMLEAGADLASDAGRDAMGYVDGPEFRAKLELLLERGMKVDGRSPAGTALHTAAAHNDVAAIDLLLDHGAAIDASGGVSYDFTPLILAASVGANDAIVRLLDRGADPTASVPHFGSILYVAAFSGERDTVRLLLDMHRSGRLTLNLQAGRASDGATPLHMAYFHNDEAMVRLLLDAGADPLAQTSDGRLPAQYRR